MTTKLRIKITGPCYNPNSRQGNADWECWQWEIEHEADYNFWVPLESIRDIYDYEHLNDHTAKCFFGLSDNLEVNGTRVNRASAIQRAEEVLKNIEKILVYRDYIRKTEEDTAEYIFVQSRELVDGEAEFDVDDEEMSQEVLTPAQVRDLAEAEAKKVYADEMWKFWQIAREPLAKRLRFISVEYEYLDGHDGDVIMLAMESALIPFVGMGILPRNIVKVIMTLSTEDYLSCLDRWAHNELGVEGTWEEMGI